MSNDRTKLNRAVYYYTAVVEQLEQSHRNSVGRCIGRRAERSPEDAIDLRKSPKSEDTLCLPFLPLKTPTQCVLC